MAGTGPAPKLTGRRNRTAPQRGEWQAAPGLGWQHGDLPDPPEGIGPLARETWYAWFRSWVASHWDQHDLQGLNVTIRLFDQCDTAFRDPTYCYETAKGQAVCINRPNPVANLAQYMDRYGLTPKGQQDRRWLRPDTPGRGVADPPGATRSGTTKGDRYRYLAAVD